MRLSLGRAFLLGIAAGAGVALLRRTARRPPAAPPREIDTPRPTPAPTTAPAWVAPVDGGCPDGYPVKAKAASGIFHVPGGLSYARTHPDRCYTTPEAATADGFRPAKR